MNRFHEWYCASSYWRREVRSAILPWATAGLALRDARVLELGPGPGLTTDWLLPRCGHLTVLEQDSVAAARLSRRLGSKVTARHGDAAAMPFSDGSFQVVLCFTMLHHLPSSAAQDALFREVVRVLTAGGSFAGSDSVWGPLFAVAHVGDTLNAVRPALLAERLARAGLQDVTVATRHRSFRWRGVTAISQP